jgi:hypothetical protein
LLRYQANATGIGGQTVNIRIDYYLGTTLNGVETTSAITAGDGSYIISNYEVTKSSDVIKIIATYLGSPSYLPSAASIEG